jgi:hypothetical protein
VADKAGNLALRISNRSPAACAICAWRRSHRVSPANTPLRASSPASRCWWLWELRPPSWSRLSRLRGQLRGAEVASRWILRRSRPAAAPSPYRQRRLSALVFQHDEAVGVGHRAQHAGALRAGGAHGPLAVRRGRGCRAGIRCGRGSSSSARGSAPGSSGHGQGVDAGQLEDGRAHELVEGDHHRHRVARQAEQPGAGTVAAPSGWMRPKAIGRPGFMAIFQNATSPSWAISA